MPGVPDRLSAALEELSRAKTLIQRQRSRQIRDSEQQSLLKALAHAWFSSHRAAIATNANDTILTPVDTQYRWILDAAERHTTRTAYLDRFKDTKAALIHLRGELLTAPSSIPGTSDTPPAFDPIVGDPIMRTILTQRWDECLRCMNAGAYLAATVMMGGLLEALLVARANKLPDKSPLFTAQSTPKDAKTGKPLDLRQWMLASYIDVAHELGWITRSAKDVAVVLRDYRNYVHPEKQRSHAISLVEADARMFWEVVKELSRQVLT